MTMMSFAALFPELAERECRTLRLSQPWFGTPRTKLPPDDYVFREAYCVLPGCDCRRVILTVYAGRAPDEVQAVISFGLDPEEPEAAPFLDPLNPQGELAAELLSLTEDVLLADDDYVARLGRHCELVKAALNDPADPIHARVPRFDLGEVPFVRAVAKVGRNEPCPCGTGKKFKRCCAKRPAPEGAAGAASP